MLSFHQSSCNLIIMQEVTFDTMIKCLLRGKKIRPHQMIDGVLWWFFQSTKQGHISGCIVGSAGLLLCFARLRATDTEKMDSWSSEAVCAIEFASTHFGYKSDFFIYFFLHQETLGVSSCGSLSETPRRGSERWKPLQLITRMQRWFVRVAASFKSILLPDKLLKTGCSIANHHCKTY